MTTIDSMFELATDLRDNGELKTSVEVLLKILDNYPNDKSLGIVYSVLGGVYDDLGERNNALHSFKKATELNPEYELASLWLYVTYASLDRDEEAISELFRFLKQFPAKLYKTTLEELIDGLKDGYMTNYKSEIIRLAKLNGVSPTNK
ncbi:MULTISPECIES: hypothetical protein [Niastella]|uniref:Tetratricopeptide repeat protein n=1 Tax=Niastella soli TaxID=2821487 RepID=A0ABS3YZ13_9BACT|nr:hypothetical protein [Niastella soli]MBO9203118.1 hypothetical protein [Niastella soli]